jgi:hypothetical protein
VSHPTLPTYAAEVAQGAALLDRELPDWPAKVDPRRLDQGFADACVLSQLYGDYDFGLDALCPLGADPDRWAVAHGYCCDADVARSQEWTQLTDAWQAELARRRGGEAA